MGIHVEGIAFSKSSKDKTATASLDRIDSTKGYIDGNIQWVHKRINTMKMDMSQKDFIDFCKQVAQTNSK